MKILGLIGDGKYIAEVTHSELEKLSGNYYGKMKPLHVGDYMDLGAGYNFTNDMQAACKGFVEAVKSFDRAHDTMRSFALMVADLPPHE